MSFMTPPDSVSLRINYTVPVAKKDEATLRVGVKQSTVPLPEQFFGIEIEVRSKDNGETTIFGPVSFSPGHPGGPFDKTFSFSVPCTTLDEDKGGGAWSRDEVLVRVRKTAAPALPSDSSWVSSNAVQVYFGVGEPTPEK